MTRVLMVLTGAKVWTMKNGFPHPTGFWAEEFIRPHGKFTAAGFEVSIATPLGVTPTPDPLSLSSQYYSEEEISQQQDYLDKLSEQFASPLKLEDIRAADWDVVFQVGGHGPMQDMAVHPTVGQLYADVLSNEDKILAAVCHGPAAFLSAHLPDGTWLMKGRRLTAFSNEEENQATFAGNAPWLLEDRLRLAGAFYEAAPPWTPHAVVDGNLITGQQQKSAGTVADEVLKKLGLSASA
jgi:putative intracellular protease/amidase